MSKVIEKVITFQLHSHMIQYNMIEELQSAYKTHHSTETTLVNVLKVLCPYSIAKNRLYLIETLIKTWQSVHHIILMH